MNERIAGEPTDEIIGEVTYGPFASPRMSAILKKFGKRAFGRSSACMEFEDFLRRIAVTGKTCLEIGTFHGVTAALLAQHFGQVLCVTIDEPATRSLRDQIIEHLGVTNVRFFDVANNEMKAELIGRLDFDFCYQDGDHTNDTLTDFDLVKKCGRVLFHEYWPLQPAVWNLVNSLPRQEVMRAHFDNLAYWERGARWIA